MRNKDKKVTIVISNVKMKRNDVAFMISKVIIMTQQEIKVKTHKCDVTYNQVWWPMLGICALYLTHQKCTHKAVMLLGVRCLAQGHLVLKVEREHCTFTPPTNNPCRTETQTHNLSITSPSLQPLGHDFPYMCDLRLQFRIIKMHLWEILIKSLSDLKSQLWEITIKSKNYEDWSPNYKK